MTGDENQQQTCHPGGGTPIYMYQLYQYVRLTKENLETHEKKSSVLSREILFFLIKIKQAPFPARKKTRSSLSDAWELDIKPIKVIEH